MKIDSLSEFNSKLKNDGVYYTFSGYFTQSNIEEIGDVLKTKIEEETNDIGFSLKVFSIFVEQVQNILFHSSEIARKNNGVDGIIVIGRKDNQFYIYCGNTINLESKESLIKQIDGLNNMTKKEIKIHYKKQLKKQPTNMQRGAGLGLIEIARRSSVPIEYDFKEVDDNNYFFAIGVSINIIDSKKII